MAFDDWIMEGDSDSPAIGWFTSNGSDSWLSSLMPYAFSALIRNLYLVVGNEHECEITKKRKQESKTGQKFWIHLEPGMRSSMDT